MEDRLSRPGLALRGLAKSARKPDLAGEVGAATDEGLSFSCSALRMCGSRRISRLSENSKLGCSTLKKTVSKPIQPMTLHVQ